MIQCIMKYAIMQVIRRNRSDNKNRKRSLAIEYQLLETTHEYV